MHFIRKEILPKSIASSKNYGMFTQIALFLIKTYRLCISPLLGQTCRFHPTCSEYALEAFRKKPFFSALWFTVKRLAKCGPWHKGGEDLLN